MSTATRRHPKRQTGSDRGSALLISLVLMVGLSLLGLGFVAISETETAISVNERHAAQVQAIAETGARAVVEFFQDPQWAKNQGFLRENSDTLLGTGTGYKRQRTVPVGTSTYTGVYRPDTATGLLLLDRPFRPLPENRFYGEEATADLEFNHENAKDQMEALNTALFGSNSRVNGRIEEIKIYAPPIIGGTLVGGFWSGGDRYGLATIKVTAERWTRDVDDLTKRSLVSRRVVRIVVGEFPTPVPGGPLQSQVGIDFTGNADVHWGDIMALNDITSGGSSLPGTNTGAGASFPWANPYDRPSFERGYDAAVWPVGAGTNWFAEIVGKEYGDPWFGSRSRGNNAVCDPNCGAYAANVDDTNIDYSGFENQISNTYPTSKLVNFPDIRYDTWKRIALAGRGMKGIYYFTHDNANPGLFKKNGQGTSKSVAYWVNAIADNTATEGARLGSGLYFFDTTDGTRPRPGLPATGGNMTPNINWSSGDIGDPFRMEGFIYLNANSFGVSGTGSSAPDALYNMPSEIYRDIGYRKLVWPGNTWAVDAGEPVFESVADGKWDYQDLDGDKEFDLVIDDVAGQTTFTSTPAYTNQETWVVKTWDPATCTALGDCSEPHEPYINFVYPETRTGAVVAKWEDPDNETHRPKKRGVAVNGDNECTEAEPPADDCTSNMYDDIGGMVEIPAVLDGIFFNEGAYGATGNADFYGALLVRGSVGSGGNPRIWFDERLLKGEPPRNMPRVLIYSSETDPAF